MQKPESRWLKKYTLLEHLATTLQNQQLHLGNPKDWEDKNDGELVKIYSKVSGSFEMTATCLTDAPDRFHFWAIFGKREKGVCLWFDKAQLLEDIGKDETLEVGRVFYKTNSDLHTLKRDNVPFTKREQYKDECEYRVLRKRLHQKLSTDKFEFSKLSLKKIYLNPWLTKSEVKIQKAKISDVLNAGFENVKVLQNRTLRKASWIAAAKSALEITS